MNPAKSKSDNSEYQVSMVEIDECTAITTNQIQPTPIAKTLTEVKISEQKR